MKHLVEKAVKKLKIKTDVIEVGPAINFEIPSKEAAFPKIDIDLVFHIQKENWPPASATTNISPQLKAVGVGLVPKVLEAPDDTRLWEISFSAIEIKLFKDIDADGGIRKKLQKIMKYLKLATEWPKTLASYHLKNVLMKMNYDHIIRRKLTGRNPISFLALENLSIISFPHSK
jgi:hypothetical protein